VSPGERFHQVDALVEPFDELVEAQIHRVAQFSLAFGKSPEVVAQPPQAQVDRIESTVQFLEGRIFQHCGS
jgi:hypothetical protein